MALTEETKIDRMEILEDGQIQVRQATVIYRDGVEINRSFHRFVLDPGKDDVSGRTDRVKAVADAIWTPDVVNARKERLKESADGRKPKLK